MHCTLMKKRPTRLPLLLLAVKNNDHDIVAYLLKNGADIEMKDFNGLTALHLAVVADRGDITEILLRKGSQYQSNRQLRADDAAWGKLGD